MIGLPPRSTRNATRFPYTTVCRSLSPAQYEQWVIAPNAEIVRRLKALHPDTPVIGFPKGAGGKLRAYADETRSEEHTSELQSLMRISYAVFCLNKKTATTITM